MPLYLITYSNCSCQQRRWTNDLSLLFEIEQGSEMNLNLAKIFVQLWFGPGSCRGLAERIIWWDFPFVTLSDHDFARVTSYLSRFDPQKDFRIWFDLQRIFFLIWSAKGFSMRSIALWFPSLILIKISHARHSNRISMADRDKDFPWAPSPSDFHGWSR